MSNTTFVKIGARLGCDQRLVKAPGAGSAQLPTFLTPSVMPFSEHDKRDYRVLATLPVALSDLTGPNLARSTQRSLRTSGRDENPQHNGEERRRVWGERFDSKTGEAQGESVDEVGLPLNRPLHAIAPGVNTSEPFEIMGFLEALAPPGLTQFDPFQASRPKQQRDIAGEPC